MLFDAELCVRFLREPAVVIGVSLYVLPSMRGKTAGRSEVLPELWVLWGCGSRSTGARAAAVVRACAAHHTAILKHYAGNLERYGNQRSRRAAQ